jgi:hypothetical protein
MSKESESSEELAALVNSYELEIHCRLCRWRGQRRVGWLNTHRDMTCPRCHGVIVLNTSERQRQITALRRQVSMLREQLMGSLESAESALSGSSLMRPGAADAPASKLGLWQLYGDEARWRHGDRRQSRARR